eukprot:361502-Chlamydomonas_euryale.AAC.4
MACGPSRPTAATAFQMDDGPLRPPKPPFVMATAVCGRVVLVPEQPGVYAVLVWAHTRAAAAPRAQTAPSRATTPGRSSPAVRPATQAARPRVGAPPPLPRMQPRLEAGSVPWGLRRPALPQPARLGGEEVRCGRGK